MTCALSAMKPRLLAWSYQGMYRFCAADEGAIDVTSLNDWKYCTRWEASIATPFVDVTVTGPPKPDPNGQAKMASASGATVWSGAEQPGMVACTVDAWEGLGLSTWM